MTTLLQDLRFALRQIRRSPGFTIAAVLILALGIAANVIVFGVLQAIILQPINVPRPDRVVTFSHVNHGYPEFSWPEVRDVRDDNTVFSAVAAESMSVFGLDNNGFTQPVWGEEVSGQYFEVVGIKPALGRLLTRADDDHPGASQAVVISWPAWKSLFASDPGVVGKTIRINKHPYTIVGVTQVRISGQATPGVPVLDTSTFPDGVAHQFTATANGAGTYTIGPFALRQLGTFHDVVSDAATGISTEISYEGVGDFSTGVDRTSETVARGEEAKFEVTFKSLSGFAGAVKAAVPDLSRITGATASWSSPAVTVPSGELAVTTVPSGDSTSVGLTIKTSSATPPGTYKINVQGANGSVTHTAPSEIELTVKE